MRRNSSRFTLVVVSLVCLLLAACNTTPSLRFITVSPPSATATAGDTTPTQFTAQFYFSDGSITDGTAQATWTSSDNTVASVSGGAATPLAAGTATITASFASIHGSGMLTVNPGKQLTSITVTPAGPTVPVGTSQQFTATGNYSDGSHSDLTTTAAWSSSNTNAATIGASTGLAAVPATATAGATSTITATVSGVTPATTMLTVGAAVPVSLTVAPASPTIALRNSIAFTATENWSDGTTGHAPSAAVSWASGTTATATFAPSSNLALGVATGTSTITATEGTLTPGTTTLTVVTGTTHYAYVSAGSGVDGYTVTAGTTPYLTPFAAAFSTKQGSAQTVIAPNGLFMYYTATSSNVFVASIAPNTGALTDTGFPELPAGSGDFNFTTIDPYGRFLYVADSGAAAQVGPPAVPSNPGLITGFTINSDGSLTPIAPVITGAFSGFSPTCLTIDRTGSFLYAANNTGNSVNIYAIDQSTGVLTPLAAQPTIAAGTGPQLATLDPSGTHLYVATQTAVSAYSLGSGSTAGQLTHLADTTVSGAVTLNNVAVDPSGTHLYVLDNGGTNGVIHSFPLSGGTIGAEIGTSVSTGGAPVGLVIDATGKLVASENNFDDTISLFTVIQPPAADAGGLAPATPPTVATDFAPTYVTFYNAP